MNLVLVSHSPSLLAALREMIVAALEVPPRVLLAGGTDDGRLGTSLRRVGTALRDADSAAGTVVVYDSGSAWLTVGFALDEIPPERRDRIVVTDAPLVEGAMAAAARAARGGAMAEVAAAAEAALGTEKRPAGAPAAGDREGGAAAERSV